MKHFVPLACTMAIAGFCASAHAEDSERDAYARVVVSETELRTGPGISYRIVYRAQRGDTFLIQGREASGFWLEVVLPDGRVAYVLGDTVEPVAVGPESVEAASKPGFFAPPALEQARGGFALMGGIFNHDGYGEFRPALVLAPAIAIEPYAGLALQKDGRRLLYEIGATLNLAPDWAIAPFLHIGGGGLWENPDDIVRKDRTLFHARAGGGLLVSLRWRVLFRFEATNVILFTEDSYKNVQSYIGGLGTYF